MTKNFMIIFQSDTEHCVRKQFNHLPTHFEKFFFGHVHPVFREWGPIAPNAAIEKARAGQAAPRATGSIISAMVAKAAAISASLVQ